MQSEVAVDLCREALMTCMIVGGPMLIVGMVVGLLISLLQALTQIQDQTVSFVPKIIAMAVAIVFCLPWMLQQIVEYSEDLIRNIPNVVLGG